MRDNLILLTPSEQAIAKSFGRTLEASVIRYRYNLEDFLRKAIQTEIFEDFLEDFTMYTQEGTYIVAKITEELKQKNVHINFADEYELKHPFVYGEIGFWLGYLLICWRCRDNIPSMELLKYDFEEIIWNYDVLHTQSIEYAIDVIKKEYSLL